jgi:hypothetical protein
MPATPHQLQRPRRRWLRVILWLVIFGSGLFVGTGLTLMAVRRGMLEAIHHPEKMPANLANRLRRPLRLSDEQAEQVEQILSQRQVALEAIRVRYQPEIEQQLDRIEAEIADVLDEKQREAWYRMFDNKRRIWIPPLPSDGDADDTSP